MAKFLHVLNFMGIWYQIQELQDFGDQPWYHNTIATVMSQKLRSVLLWCICDAITIQILNKIGGFFFVFLGFLEVKEMEWWHFFLLGNWWRTRWEAQTIFLHNWTKWGTPNYTQVRNPNPQYNWRLFLCVPPFLTSERAWEAQTKFLHNWTRLGTPNNIHNWEIQIPNIIGGSFVVFLHILQVKRLYDGISFCLASEEEDWGGTIQYYNTIKQDCGAQSIL